MGLKKRMREKALWRWMAMAALIAVAAVELGMYRGPQVMVEDTCTVRPGDTVWDIACMYVERNTGGPRDVREFISGIEELNPGLRERHDQVAPGDVLRVNYWVRGNDE